MKLLLFTIVVLMVVYVHGYKEPKNIEDFGQSLRKFTGSMYYRIAQSSLDSENIFFSPLSVSQALGMVMIGSKHNTFRQINDALMINKRRNYSDYNYRNLFKKIYNKVFNTSRGNPSSQTLLANRMFLQQDYPVKPIYKADLKTYFDSDAVPTDFGDPEAAANQINGWVANKTENLITDLMDSDTISDMTRLVLVNTLFFKASWKYKPVTKGLEKKLFYSTGKTQRVPFMLQNNTMKYRITEKLEQVAIPYRNDEAHLILIQGRRSQEDLNELINPSAPGELMKYLKNLPNDFDKWINSTATVSLPMFSIDKTMDMTQTLKLLSITDMFSSQNADLSGITEQEQLYVSTFMHRAKVTVNEEGTVAAAASGVSILARSAPLNPTITFDRPFLFAIYRKTHLLFFGRVSDPVPEK